MFTIYRFDTFLQRKTPQYQAKRKNNVFGLNVDYKFFIAFAHKTYKWGLPKWLENIFRQML